MEMEAGQQVDEPGSDGHDRSGEHRAPALVNITPLELRWRNEWNEAREEHIGMSIELARAIYLIKRIAGWTDYTPEDLEIEARDFLKMYGHHPPEWGEQGNLL